MAKTFSTMLPLGTELPNFTLTDGVSDRVFSNNDFSFNHPILVMFISNHCPFVIHVRKKFCEIVRLFQSKGLQCVAISSNDQVQYPQDAPEKMAQLAQNEFSFPYLFDESQEVAKNFNAACTPEFYLFDKNHKLYYRGRLDASNPSNGELNDGMDLINALNLLLDGKEFKGEQYPSVGCNIKWKKN